ncbi:MAG: peptidylprolyl isomerase [Bacteroidia bacterium]
MLSSATCNRNENASASDNENSYSASAISSTQSSLNPVVNDSIVKPQTIDTVEIVTTMGSITVVLYNETPLHHDNFLKLVNSHFYDSLTFHRVIPNFMIQGGDPNSKDSDPNNDGMGGPGYRVPAEFNPNIKHKKGALAAARDNNPQKASSGSQFYICHVATNFLDGNYTVFGETVKGFDVIDKIANTPTGPNDRPVTNVMIITMKHLNAPKAAEEPKSKKGKKSSRKGKNNPIKN